MTGVEREGREEGSLGMGTQSAIGGKRRVNVGTPSPQPPSYMIIKKWYHQAMPISPGIGGAISQGIWRPHVF